MRNKAPRPKAPGAGNQGKRETRGARKTESKKKKGGGEATREPQKGQSQPGGGPAKQKDEAAKRKGEAHQNAPGRPACLTRPGRTSTRTHARDPGVASSDSQGELSASTRNSPRAPAESPAERRTVQETGRVSDGVHTRKPPQRTQPKTNAGGTCRGQPHRGAPNGYNAERAQRPGPSGGQQQAE